MIGQVVTGRRTQEEITNEIESVIHSSTLSYVDLIEKIKMGIQNMRNLAQVVKNENVSNILDLQNKQVILDRLENLQKLYD